MNKIKKIISFIFCCFLFMGCVTTMSNIKPWAVNYQSKKTSIVIGKVQFNNFKRIHKKLVLKLKNVQTKKESVIEVDQSSYLDNVFGRTAETPLHEAEDLSVYYFINLKPGMYEIVEASMGRWSVYPGYFIEVENSSSIYYVGTLNVTNTGNEDTWTADVKTEVDVLDEREEAAAEFKNIYDYDKDDIEIVLLQS